MPKQLAQVAQQSKGKTIKQAGILRSCSVNIDVKESHLLWG
jgi:hypothetical protein